MLNATEILVLAAMARLGAEAYGVTIREDVVTAAGRPVSLAAVYAALDHLDRLGLARPWLSAPRPERGGRARRHYHLTPAGRTRLRRERDAALRLWHGVPIDSRSGRR